MTSTLTMMMTAVSALRLVGDLVDFVVYRCLLNKHYLIPLLAQGLHLVLEQPW